MYSSNPSITGRMWNNVFFYGSKAYLKLKFSFSKTSCLNQSYPTVHPYQEAGEKKGLRAFSIILVRRKTQTLSSRTWSQATDSVSYNDNRYAKRAFVQSLTPIHTHTHTHIQAMRWDWSYLSPLVVFLSLWGRDATSKKLTWA